MAIVAGLALVRGGSLGFALGGVAAAGVVWLLRERLVADDSGVTIVNLVRVFRIPWSEIDEFRMRQLAPGLATCLEIRRHDRGAVRSWVVMTSGRYGFARSRINSILADLRRRHALAAGEAPALADRRALDEALAAAESGDFALLESFVMEERGDLETLQRTLHALASEGRIDLGALRLKHRAAATIALGGDGESV